MNTVKKEKLSHQFTEEIGLIIETEINDNIGFTTITGSDVTPDLSYAKIYFTTIGADKKVVAEKLNKASGYIKNILSRKIQLRRMPELKFIYDDSIEYGNNIEKIIKDINKKED